MPPRTEPSLEHLRAAHRFYAVGDFDAALRSLDQLCADVPGADVLRGACLSRARRTEEAIAVFTGLLAREPDCHEALTWMCVLRRDKPDEALGYALRAVALRPEDASGYGALGTLHLAAQEAEPAISAFRRAVELAPNVAEHRHNLALALLLDHRPGESAASLREAIALDPRNPRNRLVLASILSPSGKIGEAIECLVEGLALAPDHGPLHTALGNAFASIRNDAAAERHHRRATEISPEGRRGSGAWLLNQGRFDEANVVFRTMLDEGVDPAYALYGLMQGSHPADDAFVAKVEALLASDGLRPRGRMHAHYALGRAHERREEYGAAMVDFDAANRLAESIYHGGRPTPIARFAEEHARVRRLYETIRNVPPGSPTEAPILIVGMIRSGTTLLDQIVSSHPDVASGGELRFWMEEIHRLVVSDAVPTSAELGVLAEEYVGYARLLAGSEPRFTDKMPLNFALLGPIHVALPNARFLHIRRNPVDTALSIWTTFFGQGPAFAYDKRNIVAYLRQYRRTMDDWRAILPVDRLLELDYEDLVAHPEPTIRRVVDFLDLPWNDACLRHDQNRKTINTPSRWQARQPIYRTSVERWHRYKPWLGEFAELRENS